MGYLVPIMNKLKERTTLNHEAHDTAILPRLETPNPQDEPIPASSEHETKFVMASVVVPHIMKWLQCRCRPDPRFPAGIVSSIYYDTHDWQFLREKINSDYLKTKVRLRWYSDIHDGAPEDRSFIEAKFKRGARRRKIRLQAPHTGRWLDRLSLGDPRLLVVPQLLGKKEVLFFRPLIPTFRIRYKRFRFCEPLTGARLSIDHDIQVPDVNWRMVPRTQPFSLRQSVFEMKGNLSDLPDVLHQLTAMGCRKESFSKYSRCYEKIMGVCF